LFLKKIQKKLSEKGLGRPKLNYFLFIYYPLKLLSLLPESRIHRILPHIATYRQTSFTIQDWHSEHRPTAQYYSWWNLHGDLRAYCKTEETRTGRLYLSSFLVTPEYRGTGTSKAFLSSVLESAAVQGYETVLLKVHEDNPVAKRLYESVGFVTNQKWQKRYEMIGRTQPFLQ